MTTLPVLADAVFRPRSAAAASGHGAARIAAPAWVREVTLVAGAVVFLTVMAQIVVPLPFTPVPLSLSTFAVILTGAALGPWRGLAAMALYLAVGILGGPVFAGWGSGWEFASFGYILGYLPAAALVGWGASRGSDRKVGTMALGALLASAAIYAVGVTWLVVWLPVGLAQGLQMGLIPFLIGDAIKIAAAALVLPATWKIVKRVRGEN